MDIVEAIMTTRAVRRFRDDAVSDDDLLTCLRAAQQAPSGGNVQPQQYVVVRDPSRKAALGDIYRRAYTRYSASLPAPRFRTPEDEASWARTKAASDHLAATLATVPVLVLFLQPVIPWFPSDGEGSMDIGRLDASVYPAVQNFCVVARSLGLGTALTTVIRMYTDEVLAALEVTGNWEIAALVPVGRPTGNFGVARRKPVEAVTHWESFGNRPPRPEH